MNHTVLVLHPSDLWRERAYLRRLPADQSSEVLRVTATKVFVYRATRKSGAPSNAAWSARASRADQLFRSLLECFFCARSYVRCPGQLSMPDPRRYTPGRASAGTRGRDAGSAPFWPSHSRCPPPRPCPDLHGTARCGTRASRGMYRAAALRGGPGNIIRPPPQL